MDKHICSRCGKPLDEKKLVWLELDRRNDTWHKPSDDLSSGEGEVPQEHSGGMFAYGPDCAKKVVAMKEGFGVRF